MIAFLRRLWTGHPTPRPVASVTPLPPRPAVSLLVCRACGLHLQPGDGIWCRTCAPRVRVTTGLAPVLATSVDVNHVPAYAFCCPCCLSATGGCRTPDRHTEQCLLLLHRVTEASRG